MSVLHELYPGDELTVSVMPTLSGIFVARVDIAEHDFHRKFLVRKRSSDKKLSYR